MSLRFLAFMAAAVTALPLSAATPPLSAASASSTQGSQSAALAIDGNTGTYYSSAVHSDPNHTEWLSVDLGSKLYSLHAIVLTSRQNGYGFPADFDIQASDDASTWTDVPQSAHQNYSNPGTQPVTVPCRDFVAARYLRVRATKLSQDASASYALQLTEVSVRQKFPLVGALSVTGAFAATNAFDGNYSTFYSSSVHAGAAAVEWLGVDLGQTTNGINLVRLAPRQSGYGFPSTYKIQYSADTITWLDAPGASFTSAPNPGSNKVTIQFSADVSARYFRLYASQLGADNSGNYYLQLMEMNVGRVEPRASESASSIAASSTLAGSSTANLADGSTASYWSSVSHGGTSVATESFTISYASSAVLSRLALTPRAAGVSFPVDFKLQSSADGVTFTDIPGQSYTAYPNPGGARQTFNFDPVAATAIRVVATKLSADGSGNHYFQMAEAAAFRWDTHSDTWAATDNLGRRVSVSGQTSLPRADKYVGMFYFLWHGNYGHPIKDVTQILTNNPGALPSASSPPWGGYQQFHHWGQPMWGYYQTDDAFVLRKHAQMLTDAGVDTVILDISNFNPNDLIGLYYEAQWTALLDVWSDVRAAGGKTPRIVFMCPFAGNYIDDCVQQLYDDIYSQNLHPDLWFMAYDKPLILADRAAVTNSTHLNAFTFRKNVGSYFTGPSGGDQWSWLEIYPQHGFYSSAAPSVVEQVAVGVGQNAVPNGSGGWRLGAMSELNGSSQLVARGRSFHNGAGLLSTNPLDPNYPSTYGYNFAEQWGRGLDLDPIFMFVTGWNEWIAMRYNTFAGVSQTNLFVDVFNQEFSRDIEPMQGGYADNYYNQFVDYVRKFKGARQQPLPGPAKTITIDGSFADWNDVETEYYDDVEDTAHRNHSNWDASATYTDSTGRNDIQLLKVARDANNIYFYVKTRANLTSYTDSSWMRLLIRTSTTAAHWEGYNYIVNRSAPTSTTTQLETSLGGWSWGSSTNVSYRASGRELELAIPRSAIGLGSAFDPVRFDFKWVDNMTDNQDSMEFYRHGDAAPNQRFRYRFDEFGVQF